MTLMRRSLALAVLMPTLLRGQIESVTQITVQPRLFERTDFVVMVTGEWENPYRSADISLDLELTAPSGARLVVPAYFERGESGASSVWRVRFAPRERGLFHGRFVLQRPGQTQTSAPLQFHVSGSPQKGFLRLADAWTFRFDNGEPFRGIGQNLCWESRAFDDSRHFKSLHENERYNYEYLLGQLGAHGGNFFRVWMCAWNLPLEWKKVTHTDRYANDPDHFNASAIQRMDDLVELAAASGTYFMLALDPHGSFMSDGWEDNSYNVKNGGPVATPAEFFTDARARSQYKDRLRYLVARWGFSPNLAVWEFFNEVDNAMYASKQSRIPDEAVTSWHAEMAAYLKRLDPYGRAVSTSVSHRDVAGLAAIPALDFNQRHIYKATDSIPDTIRRHLRDTGKPYVIGEFGYEWDWTKNFTEFGDRMDHDFKQGLWLGLFSPTPILPMSWWWEFFDDRKLTAYFSRVRALHERMLEAGKGAYAEVAVAWEGDALRHVLAVRCGNETFVLLVNASQAAASGRINIPANDEKAVTLYHYDPETSLTMKLNAWSPLTVPAHGNLILIATEAP